MTIDDVVRALRREFPWAHAGTLPAAAKLLIEIRSLAERLNEHQKANDQLIYQMKEVTAERDELREKVERYERSIQRYERWLTESPSEPEAS